MSDLETLGEYRPDHHLASLSRGSRARYPGVAGHAYGVVVEAGREGAGATTVMATASWACG